MMMRVSVVDGCCKVDGQGVGWMLMSRWLDIFVTYLFSYLTYLSAYLMIFRHI